MAVKSSRLFADLEFSLRGGMPPGSRGVLSELNSSYEELMDLDSNTVFLYWMRALSNHTLLGSPDLLRQDLTAGPRRMLARCLYDIEGRVGRSLVKIIRKIDLQGNWSTTKYNAVLWAIKSDAIMRPMRHLQHVNVLLLVLLHQYTGQSVSGEEVLFSQSKFVHEILIGKRSYTIDDLEKTLKTIIPMFLDAYRMARILDVEDRYNQVLMGFRSEDELQKIHDDLVEMTNIEYMDSLSLGEGSERYPSPPINGDENILPITSIEGLAHEGRYMHHCIFSYLGDVLTGSVYMYKMISPERATILVNPDTFRIMEMKLKYNDEPSVESWNSARSWARKASYAHRVANDPSLYAQKSQGYTGRSESWFGQDISDAVGEAEESYDYT